MRRNTILVGVCTVLLGVSSLLVRAERIIINVDDDKAAMTVSLDVKNADVGQVLTSLFNQTGNKYNVQLAAGVEGNIDTLQLTDMPFDKAIESVLGSVKNAPAKLTYTKDGTQYRIESGSESGVVSSPAKVEVIKRPDGDFIPIIKVVLAPIDDPLTKEPDGSDPNAPAAKECILAMITVKNIPVGMLAEDLGGGSIPAYNNEDFGNSSSSSRGSRNNRNNDDYYNNNGFRLIRIDNGILSSSSRSRKSRWIRLYRLLLERHTYSILPSDRSRRSNARGSWSDTYSAVRRAVSN
jgi:hypothetical protein